MVTERKWLRPGGKGHNIRLELKKRNPLIVISLLLLLLFTHSVMSDSLWPHGLQHANLPCPSPSPGACSNTYSLSWWCHPTILSSVIPFSFCLQSFSASGSFSMSEFFTSGCQSIGASASASVLPMNIQDWFPLGLTGLISYPPCNGQEHFSITSFPSIICLSLRDLLWCPM